MLRWNEATDRQMGRWRSTAFPGPKANWERLGKDLVLLNSPDMMGKSILHKHLHEDGDHLMLSLLGDIRGFVSTLTPITRLMTD